ncbi:MAG: YihY/virulence factor BrkB family protein [Propionibacteriaceae bacterium]|jgi:membrane protein|nr:YihY/virulence factor BrkB family protein [Propionibacteriaceae bacterium]
MATQGDEPAPAEARPRGGPDWTRLRAAGQAAAGRWQASRANRTLARYGAANGGVMAGGIAYSALFSLFAVLTIAFTVMAKTLGANEALTDAIDRQLSAWLPGALDTGQGGLISPEKLARSGALSATSVVAGVVLVWSAVTAMTAVRAAVRSMFGLSQAKGEAWKSRLLALAGFGLLGLALLASALVSLAATAGEDWTRSVLNSPAAALAVRWAAYGVSFAVDASVVALVFWVVAGARPPKRDLAVGCLAAGVAMGLIKRAGAGIVGRTGSNALLASAATVVTLLVWVNLMARVLLYVAAWTADPPPADRQPAGQPTRRGRRRAGRPAGVPR